MKRRSKTERPIHHTNSFRTTFQNPWPSATAPTWAEMVKVSFPLSWYPSKPHHDLEVHQVKVVKPDWGADALSSLGTEPANRIVGTWLGHAGAMVEFKPTDSNGASTYILFDPIFSMRAGPTQFTGPARFRETPCRVSDLPGCHAVFISHNHYDHLDLPTVLEINKIFPATKWFVPLRNKPWFTSSGIKAENVMEMDWWGSWDQFKPESSENTKDKSNKLASTFKITCVPSQHTSGRYGIDQATTLWCGWVVEQFAETKDEANSPANTRTASIYHAGDTGYRRMTKSADVCPVFKEIGEKFGGFDLSFIPIWRGGSLGFISYAGLRLAHHEIPSALHCSPADAVAIHKDVKSRNSVAVHFGTFIGSENESHEAVVEFLEACRDADVKGLKSEDASHNGRAGILHIGGSVVVNPQTKPSSTEAEPSETSM